MALFDKNTWYILKHLHHSIAAQAAARIEFGEQLTPQAFLVSPSPAHDGQSGVHIAEVASEFMDELLSHGRSQRTLMKYLSDALQEGSLVQRSIDREHGIQATYTVSVQETTLPNADSYTQARPALLVLINGKNFTLPIFHLIEVLGPRQRRCQLRSFPDMQEIEAVQHMLQTRPQSGSTLH
jgi:hypothetical protein